MFRDKIDPILSEKLSLPKEKQDSRDLPIDRNPEHSQIRKKIRGRFRFWS